MDEREVCVLFGSQTGTAQEPTVNTLQDAAERYSQQLHARGFRARVMACDQYDVANLPLERVIVFLVSTTGDGEMPDNARLFWRFLLRKDLDARSLESVKCAVFGFGDSAYAKYNAAARKLYARLLQLGATMICERGLGDEQSTNGVNGDFDVWCDSECTPAIYQHFGEPIPAAVDLRPVRYNSRYTIETITPTAHTDHIGAVHSCATMLEPVSSLPSTVYRNELNEPLRLRVRLTEKRRLTAPVWTQNVMHFHFSLLDAPRDFTHNPGDVAVLFPENPDDVVAAFCERLGLNQCSTVRIRGDDTTADCSPAATVAYPNVCTVGDIVKRYLDVCSIPRRSLLQQLSFFAADPEQRDKLLEMASTEGVDVYQMYCVREKHSILELLQEFTSIAIPIESVLELLPIIRPRQFSIASSMAWTRGAFELCVGIVAYKTGYGREIRGLCSSWLASMLCGTETCVYMTRGTFNHPATSTPLLLIGPGTGIAPMRSILQHRSAMVVRGETTSPVWLVCGCRSVSSDWIYHEEFETLAGMADTAAGITVFMTAFSRDQPKKVYVQDLLKERAEEVYKFVFEENAVIFISGSAKQMPSDVIAALKEIVMEVAGVDETAAQKKINTLERQRRLLIEAWS